MIAFTPLHNFLGVVMGHGMELLIAAVFLYRAMDGQACKHKLERPLYAFVALFVILTDLRFSYLLWSSTGFQYDYREAKGGGDWMDFSVLSRDYLSTELSTLAWFFLLACLLTPVAAYFAFRSRSSWQDFLRRVLAREA